MNATFRTGALLFVALAIGCAKIDDEGPAQLSADARAFLETCPLAIHAVSPSGVTQDFTIIRTEHISSIEPAASFAEGEHAILVYLNEEGRRRMLRYTSANTGREMANFCSDIEMYRATIQAPFSSPFRLVFSNRMASGQ